MRGANPSARNGIGRQVRRVARAGGFCLVLLMAAALLPRAYAVYPGARDANWPCMAIKVPELSLATVWAGPSVDAYTDTWSQDREVANLAEQLSQRRLPLKNAEDEITTFAGQLGSDRIPKLLSLVAGLFSELNSQRSSVIAGLDRFGAQQVELADQIRSRADTLHDLQAKSDPDVKQIAALGGELEWETRLFEQRRQVTQYVCQVPDQIEQRFFALVRAIQQNLG